MRYLSALTLLVVAGCGSSPPKAEEPKAASPTPDAAVKETAPEGAAEPKAEEESKGIPDACAGEKSACVMPRGFVKRLCGGSGTYPELALMFFQKGSPWRRAYVSVKEAAPFNGMNGPSSEEKLTFEEELLVLSENKVDTGGMQVSGAGSSYDLLRWDGTCVTLSAEEVRLTGPSKPKHAAIPWRILEDATQNALLQNEALATVATERKKECKGATIGAVSAKCEKADKKLNDLVVDAVRGGTTVPKPSKVP
jgi:hypothetical protein